MFTRGKTRARNHLSLSPLSQDQILAWADAYREKTGHWPGHLSGPIEGTAGETWGAINRSLVTGIRGLPGGSSLAKLFTRCRGARMKGLLPPLFVEQILGWADSHRERTGNWPKAASGVIREAEGETWKTVDGLLRRGQRRLPGGSSLARLLAEKRGEKNHLDVPRLSIDQILKWVDAFRERFGRWPTRKSGPITDCNGERGSASTTPSNRASGLPGGFSLVHLVACQTEIGVNIVNGHAS